MNDLCRRGHELTPENTYVRPSGARECRECNRVSARAWWGRERTARLPRRYPLEPLLKAAGMSLSQFGRRYGISGTTRQKLGGAGLTHEQADRWAARAGFNPAEVWLSWIDDEFADLAVECAERSCSTRFLPTSSRHRFCSTRCGSRERKRQQYATDPVFAAKERQRVAAYKAASRRAARLYAATYREVNADVLAEKRRAYRAANRDAILARRRAQYAARKAAA